MAKARRNLKTHPKVRDEEDTSTFVDPSREDQPSGTVSGRTEIVDVFGKEETVDTGAVDLDSAAEGDARSMASEDGETARVAEPAVARAVTPARTQTRGDEGDEDRNYSRAVRKRVARERALVNRERALREQVQAQLAEERAARQATEERLDRIERAQTEVAGSSDVKALQAKIEALIPQIAAATEAGDTAKALTLQMQLGDLQGDLKLLKYDLAQKQRQASVRPPTPATPAADTPSDVDPEAAASAERFKKANRHWWNRSANKEAREDAVTIDREILEELRTGDLDFEPYSDEHWEEVARRLHESYPNLELQDLDGVAYDFEGEEMNDRTQARRPPPARGNGTRGAPQTGRRTQTEADLARAGKVTLNEEDFNTMRLFKMDPNKPEDKKYFAKEKMRSILTGERQAQRGER
jgi:hypothetical protein